MQASRNTKHQGSSEGSRVKTLLLLALIVLTFGCGDKVWVKQGATQKDFGRDKALCIEKTHVEQQVSITKPSEETADPKKFAECMTALGYELEYNRPLNPRRFWRRD